MNCRFLAYFILIFLLCFELKAAQKNLDSELVSSAKAADPFLDFSLQNELKDLKSQFKTERSPFVKKSQDDWTGQSDLGLSLQLRNEEDERISLSAKHVPLSELLSALAVHRGLNIIISDKVKGFISLHLQRLSFDETLNMVLELNQLAQKKVGNTLMILTEEEFLAAAKKKVAEAALLKDSEPLSLEMFQLKYAKASSLATVLKNDHTSFLSPQAAIHVDARTNTLWIKDKLSQQKTLRQMIARLDRPSAQVLIEARIVNVNRDFMQELGLHFHLHEEDFLPLQSASPAYSENKAALLQYLNIDMLPFQPAGPLVAAGLAFARLEKNILLDLELSALESEGCAEIISSPTLMTTNQTPAFIQAGEEIPYQELSNTGMPALAFKKAVLRLKVVPEIISDRHILMALHINQDTLSAKLFNGTPSILTKEIQTNVLVEHGQTIVLGGIYKKTKRQTNTRVPFLGNLPFLGALFRQVARGIKNEELLIFITPKIIANDFK